MNKTLLLSLLLNVTILKPLTIKIKADNIDFANYSITKIGKNYSYKDKKFKKNKLRRKVKIKLKENRVCVFSIRLVSIKDKPKAILWFYKDSGDLILKESLTNYKENHGTTELVETYNIVIKNKE